MGPPNSKSPSSYWYWSLLEGFEDPSVFARHTVAVETIEVDCKYGRRFRLADLRAVHVPARSIHPSVAYRPTLRVRSMDWELKALRKTRLHVADAAKLDETATEQLEKAGATTAPHGDSPSLSDAQEGPNHIRLELGRV